MANLKDQFWTIFKAKGTKEVVLERDNMIVMLGEEGDDYLTIVEMNCPDIDLKRWEYLFRNFTREDPKFVKECQLARTLQFEGQFETSIRVMRFPFVNERAAINTQYNSFDLDGEIDSHLVLISSLGNEELMN